MERNQRPICKVRCRISASVSFVWTFSVVHWHTIDAGVSNREGLQPRDATDAKPVTPATEEKKNSNVPDEVMHLLSIVDALEAILSLKRSGRVKQVLFRADQKAVEQAARRDFKVCAEFLVVMRDI
jgi:hypothetical protein